MQSFIIKVGDNYEIDKFMHTKSTHNACMWILKVKEGKYRVVSFDIPTDFQYQNEKRQGADNKS